MNKQINKINQFYLTYSISNNQINLYFNHSQLTNSYFSNAKSDLN